MLCPLFGVLWLFFGISIDCVARVLWVNTVLLYWSIKIVHLRQMKSTARAYNTHEQPDEEKKPSTHLCTLQIFRWCARCFTFCFRVSPHGWLLLEPHIVHRTKRFFCPYFAVLRLSLHFLTLCSFVALSFQLTDSSISLFHSLSISIRLCDVRSPCILPYRFWCQI